MNATMTDLSAFPITKKWPAKHPDRIQLYSLPTPNGVKASIMLEETGLPYEPHLVNFDTDDQKSPEFLIAQSVRQDSGDHRSQRSGRRTAAAVRIRRDPDLSRRQERAVPAAGCAARYETIQWLMFQMGGIGPMFGQVGFFHKFAGKDYEDKRPRDRYVAESKRLLEVLNSRLAGSRLDHGRRLHDRRYRNFPVGAKPDRLLRRGRSRGLRGFPARQTRARCIRRASRRRQRRHDPRARMTIDDLRIRVGPSDAHALRESRAGRGDCVRTT